MYARQPKLKATRSAGRAWCRTAMALAVAMGLSACKPESAGNRQDGHTDSGIQFRSAGTVQSAQLDEISGLQASRQQAGVLWVHNDDGPARVHALGTGGEDLGYFDIEDAVNVDWEDMTIIPAAIAGSDRDLLVLADIGDNSAKRSRVWLYLVEEPQPGEDGRYSGSVPAHHWVSLAYPDGPRDAESIAWDPYNEQILILSKRDKPARLYALDVALALQAQEATLAFVGEVSSLRAPTPADRQVFGERTPWISQATGLDISADGRQAALISYRSLYLYERQPQVGWLEALNTEPVEIIGPASDSEEAVSYGQQPGQIWVTSEGLGAALVEFRQAGPEAAQQP
jgi:hypothetical protein